MKWTLAELSFCAVLVLSLFLLSCTQQSEPVQEVVVTAPPPQQQAPEPQAQEAAPSQKDTQNVDALLAQLQEEEEKTAEAPTVESNAAVSEEVQPSQEPEAALEPETPRLSNSKGCRALGSPATYEACLNGCTKLCGDVALVDCQDYEGMYEGNIYQCYACSCL